jgi:glycosyltransferase involved in cell wall biosynthesis
MSAQEREAVIPDAAREPLVTVVVPTFNRANLIGETIESILAQEYLNLELVVVSDGCTDDTEAVVGSYADPRVRFVKQENSGGPAKPRNRGVACAKGKYLAFCDDDDLWMPQKIRKQVAVMEGRPDTALCFTRGVTFGGGDFFSRHALKRGVDRNHFRALLYGNFIANSSVLVRKSVLDNVGPFNIETFLHGAEDYEMWLRIAYRYPLVRLNEPLIRYRVHPSNLAANRAKGTLRGIYIVRNVRRIVSSHEPVGPALAWQWLKYAVYSLAQR